MARLFTKSLLSRSSSLLWPYSSYHSMNHVTKKYSIIKPFLQERAISSQSFLSTLKMSQNPRSITAIYDRCNRTISTKVSALSLNSKKRKGKKISMVTAYDYPSAIHVARAGIDIILVGDSVAMVELGYETTQPMKMDKMIHHCQSVKRGVKHAATTPLVINDYNDSENSIKTTTREGKIPLLVGDMPFGSYEYDDTDIALRNAYQFVQEAGMDTVKLEGGSAARARTARKIVDGGVAVMGHIGLTPQAISVIGGFRAQGRTAKKARALLDDALRLQDSGVYAIVLECVPSNVAKEITETLEIPTIGIGAGRFTSGQVLVYHDMLGMLSHPHHEQFVPKFCKKYAQVGHTIQSALTEFKDDVENGDFPNEEYSPYIMSQKEKDIFDELLKDDEKERQKIHQEASVKLTEADEWESLSLYGGSSGGESRVDGENQSPKTAATSKADEGNNSPSSSKSNI